MANRTWSDDLPDVSQWQPREKASEALRNALLLTCRGVQRRLTLEGEIEREFNIDNFDSGPGLEALVRRELANLLPSRYRVSSGVVDDARGRTAGDCDVLISDHHWSPAVKLAATTEARRTHLPVESLYAVIEVKQTATIGSLDEAMGKLVTLARLDRPMSPSGRITENQYMPPLDRPDIVTNVLFTIILMTRPSGDVSFVDLAQRFFDINQRVERDSAVKMLCVLGGGVAYYTSVTAGGERLNAGFGCDRDGQFDATLYNGPIENCFYMMFTQLLGHVTRSVLLVQDLAGTYGPISHPCKLLERYNLQKPL